MTTTEIRSAVCKRAYYWMRFRIARSQAFRMAWANVKAMAEEAKKLEHTVKARDLKPGDTIRTEFGDYGHIVTFIVAAIAETTKCGCELSLDVKYPDGRKFEILVKKDDLFERAA